MKSLEAIDADTSLVITGIHLEPAHKDNSSAPKIEPEIHVAKFLRITTDPPIDVDKWYKKIRKCTMSERSMKWLSIDDPCHLEMTGHLIPRNYGENQSLKPNGMSAGVLALDMKDSILYKYRTPRWRKLFPPSFAEQAINCQDQHNTDTLFWMFNATNLPYKMEKCKKFIVVHIVDDSWCLYQIDIAEKTMFIMDPTMTMSEKGSMEIKHMRTAELILNSLFNRLREWYPNWHFSTFPWSYKFNYGMHPGCSKAVSGFYVLHYIKEFAGDILQIIPTEEIIAQLRKQMAYEVLMMKGNKAELASYLCGAKRD